MGFLLPLKRTATMTGSGRDVCGRPWPGWNPRSRAVLDYLEGMKPARKAEKNNFDAALEKLRDFYLSAYRTTQFGL